MYHKLFSKDEDYAPSRSRADQRAKFIKEYLGNFLTSHRILTKNTY